MLQEHPYALFVVAASFGFALGGIATLMLLYYWGGRITEIARPTTINQWWQNSMRHRGDFARIAFNGMAGEQDQPIVMLAVRLAALETKWRSAREGN